MSFPSLAASRAVAPKETRPVIYVGMAVLAAALVFIGFAPTYYLKTFTGSPTLSLLVHVHGIVYSAWILLFIVQSILVARHRTDLHRRLGLAAGLLATAMIMVGVMTAIAGARRGHNPGGAAADALAFLAFPLGDMVLFAALVGAGFYWRRQAEAHKRLMLLATVSILVPAVGRLPIVGNSAAAPIAYLAIVLAGPIYDRLVYGRFHRLYLLGALAIWVSFPIRLVITQTQAWRDFAGWLTN